MSNGSTTSQPATPSTDSPVDVIEAQTIQEAKKQVGKRAQELADLVLQQQAPPGTPKPGKR